MKSIHILLLVTLLAAAGLAYQEYGDNKTPQEPQKIDSIEQNLQLAIHSLDSVKEQLALLQEDMAYLPIQNLQEKYQQLKKSVLLIVGANAEGFSQGTAFLIGNEGQAMTNYHVVEGMERFVVMDFEGNKYEIASFDKANRQDDWQMFTIRDIFLPPLEVASTLPVIGDHCFTIGNPHGLKHTLSTGIVSGFRENQQMIQISAEIASGSSGGPLFNAEGQVIGITTGTLGEGNLNFAINLLSLREESVEEEDMIAQNGDIPSSQFTPSSEEKQLVDQAAKFYQLILTHQWDEASFMMSPFMETFQDLTDIRRNDAITFLQQKYSEVSASRIEMQREIASILPSCDQHYVVAGFLNYDDTPNSGKRKTRYISMQLSIDDSGMITGLREKEVMDNEK